MSDSLPTTSAAGRKNVSSLAALNAFSAHVARASDQDHLVTVSVETLAKLLGDNYSMLLFADEGQDGLYAIASHGYETSATGAEVALGHGVIGAAAERRHTVRIDDPARDQARSLAMPSGVKHQAGAAMLEREIALPRLTAQSQIAIPMLDGETLMGVLFLESETPGRFDDSDEAALDIAARQLGLALALLRERSPATPLITAEVNTLVISDRTRVIKHYAADDSVYIANDFLIKGVTGALFWRLLSAFVDGRPTDLSKRETRLDPNLDLPETRDIEARLILLRRRLADRCDFLHLESAGRGRFHLIVDREFTLLEVPK